MQNTFFTIDEDFDRIILNSLPNKIIKEVTPISTGWTNIVFEVTTNNENFFFRFPRDDFWSRTIIKDCEFAKYIYKKTSFNTVQLVLLYDNDRPFSMHKKIEGIPLADKVHSLSEPEIKKICNEISKFMFELHSLNYADDDIFTTKNVGVNLIDFLNELLDLHIIAEDKSFWHFDEYSKKDHTCLVHGDLNSSNIILNNNNNISAIIDFGFAGFGNKYFDIARIIGRCPESFSKHIKSSYENISGLQLDNSILEEEIKIWENIDNGYINYMKKIGIYK